MSTVLILGGIPALAAFAAFMLMERPWWWGLVAVVALGLVGPLVPILFYAALVIAAGWIAALVGTAMLMDESMLAALVYVGMSALMFVIWLTVPDGTF